MEIDDSRYDPLASLSSSRLTVWGAIRAGFILNVMRVVIIWLGFGLGLDLSGLRIVGGVASIGRNGGSEYSRSGFRWQSS